MARKVKKDKAKRRELIDETTSVALIILLLFLIFAYIRFVPSKDPTEDNLSGFKEILTEKDIMDIAGNNLEAVRSINKGEIIDGPRPITENDKKELESLFKGLDEPLYIIRVSQGDKETFVVLNNTDVVKVVPMMAFG